MITFLIVATFLLVRAGYRLELRAVPVAATLLACIVLEALVLTSMAFAAPAWRCTPSGAGQLPVCELYDR